MPYKVVFVEDEVVTREGIRDNVDWKEYGFEFCGEAADGEMALPVIQAARPDLLITDIKMPFMDGLQLSKITREQMPWIKVVILSGHDEFEYAKEAIKLGVTEYLLKPVTVQDLHAVLQKIAIQLDQERLDQENLRKLQDQVEQNQAALRERFLLKLVLGPVAAPEAIENAHQLGLDLIARLYMVVILKLEQADLAEAFNYEEYQQVLTSVSKLIDQDPDIYLVKKDWADLVLLIQGNSAEYLEEARDVLLTRVQQELAKTRYHLLSGSGAPKNRIPYIYQSFVEALVALQQAHNGTINAAQFSQEKNALVKIDHAALDEYLRSGTRETFNDFFYALIQPFGEAVKNSNLVRNYILAHVVLATVKFMSERGADMMPSTSAIHSIENLPGDILTVEQLRQQVAQLVEPILTYRDRQISRFYVGVIQQAKEYIEKQYSDPNLMLNDVANQVNLSPSHFSVVFSHETGQTFKDYLTAVRIKKAKELLLSSSLKAAEISEKVGYSDPHYFSYVFRKNTGKSPSEFRLRAHIK